MVASFPTLASLLMLTASNAQDDFFESAFTETMMGVLPEVADQFRITSVFTVGETLPSTYDTSGGYTPPGVLDGMGGWRVNVDTFRLYSNHELYSFDGTSYALCGDLECSKTFNITGARISYFDFDIETLKVKDSGIAYKYVYDSFGQVISDATTFGLDFGFGRFCSAQFVDSHEYGFGRGIEDKIQFGPEEMGGIYHLTGGSFWALDVYNEAFWRVPALGRGAWESITQLDTGTSTHVAFVLPDDTSPFDADEDGSDEAAPLFLYVGQKEPGSSDFLAKNGLRDGTLYVWVPTNPDLDSPLTFSGTRNTLGGSFVALDNSRKEEFANVSGSLGYDLDGFPTQKNLWLQARDVGAFKFSRPEDISTYSRSPNEFVLVSTGIGGFNGVDRFGTIYTMKVNFDSDGNVLPTVLEILHDGDADESRQLRSPDNLEWADNGLIYITEDKAVDDGPEFLFGEEAINPNEGQIVRIDPKGADNNVFKIGMINRSVVLDPTAEDGVGIDEDAGEVGEWESTGVLDVSIGFGRAPGTLFVFNVQAHGIEDQASPSRLNAADLVEGGQLLMLEVLEPVSGVTAAPSVKDVDEEVEKEFNVIFSLALLSIFLAASVLLMLSALLRTKTSQMESVSRGEVLGKKV